MVRLLFEEARHALPPPDDVQSRRNLQPVPSPQPQTPSRAAGSFYGFKQSEILHVAQSQYHDIGVAKELGYITCWIERRQGQQGFGGTPAPRNLTRPDFHFSSLKQLADAVDAELAAGIRTASAA